MENSSIGPSSFWTQTNAFLLKSLTYQKRNLKSNIGLIAYPILLCLLLAYMQDKLNEVTGAIQSVRCILKPSASTMGVCPTPEPPEWPALLQVPDVNFRAVTTDFIPFTDLPDESCKRRGSCPATLLLTGLNQSLGLSLAENIFTRSSLNSSDFPSMKSSDILYVLSNLLLGSDTIPKGQNFVDDAFSNGSEVFTVQRRCVDNSTFSIPIQVASDKLKQEATCVQGLTLWRNSSSVVNDELFKGFWQGNSEKKTNEIMAAYDFLNSDEDNFNVSIWYNSTMKESVVPIFLGGEGILLSRVLRSMNVVSNAYLQFFKGAGVKILIEFVKEMPTHGSRTRIDIGSLLGPLFFSWVILPLFRVVLTTLVYDKQQNLRIMMKMHGLGDGPYWLISYAYFLLLSFIYMLCFVGFGSFLGLKFFTLNDYSIQFVFYFIYINLQISFAFLVATSYSNVKTAEVVGHLYVFGSGLVGRFLFQSIIEDSSFPRGWLLFMELFPGFSLYRGVYEFADSSFNGEYVGINGMRWKDLYDGTNGMRDVLVLILVEWVILLFVAYYLDQVVSSGSGVRKHPLFFLKNLKKSSLSVQRPNLQRQGSKVLVQIEKPDVSQEREKVEKLMFETNTSHAIVCDNLQKVYPAKDGNPEKFAVRGVYLALPRGECFGMLGTNGAGKTSTISMLIGLTTPTSGTAFIEGLDLRTDMDKIHTCIGVCPQHDLLWETLTGREHLLFYGRLKNLKGDVLTQAVEESLKSVNLFNGGVADKQAGAYSGGMKRRLSVAISLIGDPKVVYLDEPSSGLDPASRKLLWNVIKHAKQKRAIILTTHSMEEAEALCDRMGIFVDGSFQCIGNSKELKARYGGYYVFTVTTPSNQDEEKVEKLARGLSPNANKIYHLSGTQKFELPKEEVRIADVFEAVENAKRKLTISAWGLTDTTLEDVFVKVAEAALGSCSVRTESYARSLSSVSDSVRSDQPINALSRRSQS